MNITSVHLRPTTFIGQIIAGHKTTPYELRILFLCYAMTGIITNALTGSTVCANETITIIIIIKFIKCNMVVTRIHGRIIIMPLTIVIIAIEICFHSFTAP